MLFVVFKACRRVWHLETSGDLPPEFGGVRDAALQKQRAQEERRGPRELRVDYVFDVPLDIAAMLTGFRYGVRWNLTSSES